jgi:hypothetical protein
MKPKYGDNIQLLMSDTDSFVYQIQTEDFYEVMKGMKEHYDMSNYSKESGLYDGENMKVIGKFKDESPDEVIECFVGIRSKCYSFAHIYHNNKRPFGCVCRSCSIAPAMQGRQPAPLGLFWRGCAPFSPDRNTKQFSKQFSCISNK